ncbi:hypothetical protein [Marinobacterium aestuariivivens]|uniref:Uncharacterized protein n=1 Tax=Marinobacterium aestuariivivens TaxID=1698799 RepID=A0ABW2A7P5_9GAMM
MQGHFDGAGDLGSGAWLADIRFGAMLAVAMGFACKNGGVAADKQSTATRCLMNVMVNSPITKVECLVYWLLPVAKLTWSLLLCQVGLSRRVKLAAFFKSVVV